MAVTQYLYTDTDAPVLYGQPGAFITVLKAVLVNGYGTKPGMGWTLEYESGTIAVFRNSTAAGSTGMYLRVDDSNWQYAIVKAYKTMSDISTGTDAIPGVLPSYSNSNIFWPKSANNNNNAIMWNFIGDERTFYLNICPWSSQNANQFANYAYIYAAGDYDSYVPSFAHNYFVAGNYDGGYSSNGPCMIDDQSSYVCCAIGRAQDNVADKYSKAWVSYMAGGVPSGSYNHQAFSVYTGQRIFYPAYVMENAVQTNITGKWRGLYGMVGRSNFTWNENYGKLPNNPTGPDLIQFTVSNNSSQGVYILNGGW
ncbi:hypothetical protein [Xanthomonas phage X1]|nr:hypothetical protein [Xanthomonas phage X1]